MAERRVSHYDIEKLLGEGVMGRVYRAVDVVLDRPVALKFLSANSLGDPAFLERFRREARMAAQLNHPNIATIHEFGEERGEVFLVMELVEGETLEDVIRRGPLSVPEVRRLGRQAASALAAAHAKGIVHRDIKPANLMLTRDRDLKIMDFGIARRTGEAGLTMQGSLVGTPSTMAPETVQGAEPGPAADLFALGCVLYEMLAGKRAFPGDQVMAVLYGVMNEDPPSLRELRADLPEDLDALIRGLLEKDPARRFGPGSAVVAALGGEGAATAPGGPGGPGVPGGSMGAGMPGGPSGAGTPSATWTPGASSPATTAPAAGVSPARTRPGLLRSPARIAFAAFVLLSAVGTTVFIGKPFESRRPDRARATALNDRGAGVAEWVHEHDGPAAADSIEAARNLFAKAARADRTYAVPWNNLGDLSRLGGDSGRAEREFRKSLAIDPSYAVARLNLAALLEEVGRPEEAEAEYRRALRDDSTLVAAPNNLAHLLVARRRPAEAIQVLVPALRRWPYIAALWRNYGRALLASGDLARAEQAFGRALELDPGQPGAVFGLAEVALARGDAEAAVRRFREVAAGPDSTLAREALARLRTLSTEGDTTP